MERNLFEELQLKKQSLVTMAAKAVEYGWITNERKQEIIDKIENDVLTIGVIGQMKCGKSTFLNAFVFEDNILPAATTPMTAALSVITYGDREKIVADFYTIDEWEEQKLTASRSLEEVQGNALEESKVKAAKELVEKAGKLGAALDSFLGKTQTDEFANLIEYVGADGKYVSITKSVTIYYPKEYLKGVEIVDTPGFNDPIVSREERTKAFLKKADVVLMMLYAGRPFDVTDREILMQNVRRCGVGKVIIGINKYDIPYQNGETEDEIKEYVKHEIKNACKTCGDDSLKDILKQAEPIPLSAEMALLSELPMGKITSDEAYKFAWNRACDNFEISSQKQMREKSHLDILASAVKQMVENEKEKILFAKPLNAIKAAGIEKKVAIEKSMGECNNQIQDLSKSDGELDDKLADLEKAEKRLKKKIESLGDDLDSDFEQIIRIGSNDLEDKVSDSCKRMTDIIDNSPNKSIESKIQNEQQRLSQSIKKSIEELSDKVKDEIIETVEDFIFEADEIFMRYVSDFDGENFIKSISKQIHFEIEKTEIYEMNDNPDENDDSGSGWITLISIVFFPIIAIALLFDNSVKDELKEKVKTLNEKFNPLPYLNTISQKKDGIIDYITNCFITQTIEPLKQQIDDIRSNVTSKAEKLAEAKKTVEKLQTQKADIERQIADMEKISF